MLTTFNDANARPTETQAVKILTQLIDLYGDQNSDEEAAHLQDYLEMMKADEEYADSYARTLGDILGKIIRQSIKDHTDIENEAVETYYELAVDIGKWDGEPVTACSLNISFEEIGDLITHDGHKTLEAINTLKSVKKDLRSLDRAVATLTNANEVEFTEHDALMTIMEIAYG